MKVWIKRACGHEEQIEVFGTASKREHRIKYEESKECVVCYETAKYADCDEVEMKYSEYKQNYADCKTKAGSYNAKEKTIVVYVPRETAEPEEQETNTAENREEAIKKIAEETGLPYESLKASLLKDSADEFLKKTESVAEQLKAAKDISGKFENAYLACLNIARLAKEYGL